MIGAALKKIASTPNLSTGQPPVRAGGPAAAATPQKPAAPTKTTPTATGQQVFFPKSSPSKATAQHAAPRSNPHPSSNRTSAAVPNTPAPASAARPPTPTSAVAGKLSTLQLNTASTVSSSSSSLAPTPSTPSSAASASSPAAAALREAKLQQFINTAIHNKRVGIESTSYNALLAGLRGEPPTPANGMPPPQPLSKADAAASQTRWYQALSKCVSLMRPTDCEALNQTVLEGFQCIDSCLLFPHLFSLSLFH
jgi:hypothetical protein